MKPLFVFDLDSTVTRCEILPLIAEKCGLGGEMARLTERAMAGNLPFDQDFSARVRMLCGVPLSRAQEIAAAAPLHAEIAGFIRQNPHRCRILTGNLDVWIRPLIEKLGMQGRCFCSHARIDGDRLLGVRSVLNKEKIAADLPRPFVAIGDGSNDIGMIRLADVGIAFGGVRELSPELIAEADMAVRSEGELISILKKLL